MSNGVSVHVLTFGLPEKLDTLKDRELKRANRNAVSKAGTRGRSLARPTPLTTKKKSHTSPCAFFPYRKLPEPKRAA